MRMMKVKELGTHLELELAAGEGGMGKDVSGCYIGDLMSLAMSKLAENNVWLTIQTNVNIVAISVLCESACVILCDGQRPDENAISRADSENIPLFVTEKSAYEIASSLSRLGI